MNDKPEPRAVAIAEPGQVPAASLTPMGLIAQALAAGASVETLNGLYALQERFEANEARKAFVLAKVAFKANAPEIFKNKHVKFTHSKGTTEYDHATLNNVVEKISAALSLHGLALDWKTEHRDGGFIRVYAILTHALGHSDQTYLEGRPDLSGGKNEIQAVASTVSFLERYTALAITGLATKDQDDDAASPGSDPHAMYITPEQIAQLQDGLDETGSDIVKFCEWLNIGALAELPATGFNIAMNAIEAKRRSA